MCALHKERSLPCAPAHLDELVQLAGGALAGSHAHQVACSAHQQQRVRHRPLLLQPPLLPLPLLPLLLLRCLGCCCKADRQDLHELLPNVEEQGGSGAGAPGVAARRLECAVLLLLLLLLLLGRLLRGLLLLHRQCAGHLQAVQHYVLCCRCCCCCCCRCAPYCWWRCSRTAPGPSQAQRPDQPAAGACMPAGHSRWPDSTQKERCRRCSRAAMRSRQPATPSLPPTCQEAALLVLLLLTLVSHKRAVQLPVYRHQPRAGCRGQQLVLLPQGQLLLALLLAALLAAASPQLLQPKAQLEELVLPV